MYYILYKRMMICEVYDTLVLIHVFTSIIKSIYY